MKKSFFLVGLNGITFWPEWGLTNLSFRPRPSGVWPERQNFKGLKGTVLNVRKPKIRCSRTNPNTILFNLYQLESRLE